MTETTRDLVEDLAWKIAVQMELHAALGTTTKAKAQCISEALLSRAEAAERALAEARAEVARLRDSVDRQNAHASALTEIET